MPHEQTTMFDDSGKARAIHGIFNLGRNGSDGFTRHPIAPRLIYTDGIRDVCEAAGAFWTLDVIGTEATPILLRAFNQGGPGLGIITLAVRNSSAVFNMTTADNAPPIWTRRVPYTDFPAGEWVLYLACDQVIEPGRLVTVLCLPSEN